ncbi:AmtB protein [Candidatus Vecturithrix granuli]|uniref:AmtB protein n=1 Tax=Vecturithrix granuli TaxID=1499967 RepID=A0A081C876_VECG1|nr:AmtB protein [Candidatus Vecturithrix granuli]
METESPLTYDSNNFIVTDRSGSRRIIIWGFLSTLFFITLFTFNPSLLQPLDLINYDQLLRNFPDNDADNRLVIVDLDEKSLTRYGQWPWPRYRVAELFDKIAAMEPAVISLDVVFAEPDRTSIKRLLKDLADAYKLPIAVNQLPDELSDNDLILAETLTRGPFVLGHTFHFNRLEKSSEQCVLHPVKVSFLQNAEEWEEDPGLPESAGVLCNLRILSEKVSASGFLNSSPDQGGGILRRLPLLIQYNGEIYASLALATILKLQEVDNLLLKKEGNILQSINYKGTSVPVDPHGQMLIKFRGPKGNYEYISAADIMDGRVSSERLHGRITFVGTSAAGLKESRITPFDPVFPGVEVHATVVDNLLTGDFITVPGWSNGMVLLLVLILGVSLTLFITFRSAASGFIIMLLFIAGLWLATQQAFFRLGLFVGTTFPIFSVVCHYIFLTVLKHRLEEKKLLSGMRELILTQGITIESMANLTEYRDPETGGHIQRTRRYVKLLAEHIKQHDKYKHFLSDANIDMLYKSAPLHDIGKVGIPDHILLKPGPLTREEFEIMKTHTVIGRDVLESAIRKLGKKSFLTIAAEIAYSHQEKWDGSGYPQGLKGEAIPISGRLMALADVYDTLISKRVYKSPFPHALAVEIIKKGRGTHFDPDMVDAFLEIHEQFRNIACEFADFQEGDGDTQEDESYFESTLKVTI